MNRKQERVDPFRHVSALFERAVAPLQTPHTNRGNAVGLMLSLGPLLILSMLVTVVAVLYVFLFLPLAFVVRLIKRLASGRGAAPQLPYGGN